MLEAHTSLHAVPLFMLVVQLPQAPKLGVFRLLQLYTHEPSSTAARLS